MPKAKAKRDRSIKKKGAFDKYFSHWENTCNATPHWRWRQHKQQAWPCYARHSSGSLCTGSDTRRFESVDPDKGTSSDVHLMAHSGKEIQNLDERIFLLPSQKSWVGMLGTTLDYLRPSRTNCNHNRSFPQKREWWDTVF